MNKYTWKHFVGCMALVLLASCGGQKEEHNEKEGVETVLPEQLNEVTVVKLLPSLRTGKMLLQKRREIRRIKSLNQPR